MNFKVRKPKYVLGSLQLPSDKSISHRALLLAANAKTRSVIDALSRCEDCLHTVSALRAFGVRISFLQGDRVVVLPPAKWSQPAQEIFCGNSGTLARLLSGVIASRNGIAVTLTGDPSLSKRPMERVIAPLTTMGARFDGSTLPLKIEGSELESIDYESSIPSAQVKSSILLAGLGAMGKTSVKETCKSRDHTERLLQFLGVSCLEKDTLNGYQVEVEGGAEVPGFELKIPGDFSSAAFWIILAGMTSGAEVTLNGAGVNPTRTGLLEVLSMAGVRWELYPQKGVGNEPVADIYVPASKELKAFQVGSDLVPRLIDEIPVLAVLASQCQGVSHFLGVEELKVKESDRIKSIMDNLRKMGGQIETFKDGFAISGPAHLKSATIESESDHRIAMAFTIAGLIAEGETTIKNVDCVSTSYPGFFFDLEKICTF